MSVLSTVLAGNPGAEREAIRSVGRPPLRWGELAGLATDTVARLRGAGVRPGDRVGILMPDGRDMALCCLAAMEAGTCVPLNPGYPVAELEAIFALTGVSHLIVTPDTAKLAGSAAARGTTVLQVEADGWSLRLGETSRIEGEAPRDEETALLLLTSGSTAKPKLVPLSHANLVASMGNLVRSLGLTEQDRCLNMMPMFHVGGLIDLFLAPLSAGGSVACAPSISAASFFAALERERPTWFQGVPTVLKEIMAFGQAQGRHLTATGLRFVRSVSSPLPGALLTAFESAFRLPVIEIFGMTETSGLIASNPMPPGVRKQGSVGVSAGPEIAILDATGNPAPAGRRGEVVVRGKTVTAGYLNPELRRSDFFVGDWLRTGDEGYLDKDGYLYITGRIKEIINRGGEKISPRQIDELMAEMDGVQEAAAYARPHPTLGEEVALAVVLKPGATVTAAEITAHLAPHLASFKVPKTITFLDALPRVPSGKLDRKAIPASVEQAQSLAAQTPFAAPETRTEKLVARLWQKTLGIERVGRGDNFFDLGGDSLTATTFIIDLEASLGRSVPPALLFEAPTLNGFAAALDRLPAAAVATPGATGALPRAIHDQVRRQVAGWKGTRQTSESLIVGRNTIGALPPLFWGVTAEGEFSLLGGALNENRPLYALRSLSYIKGKSEANTRLLAAHYAGEIERIQPSGPILIGGFCDGGLLAFHTALELRRQGREIAALLLQNRFVAEPYDQPVVMFWSRTRWLNAHDIDVAERGWNRFYSGPLTVRTLPFEHTQVYVEENIETFADQLEEELTRIEAGGAATYARRFPLVAPLTEEAYRARVVARVPLLPRQGGTIVVPVTVTNEGSATWAPTAGSGISLSATWRNFDGYPRVPLDGYAALDRPVPPGGRFEATLTLTVPRTGLPVLLLIDLLEEGVGWFGERGGKPSRTVVLPLRQPLRATG